MWTLTSDNLKISRGQYDLSWDNFTYRFEQGCLYHIQGRNGIGKTSLLRCLAGYFKADSGEIHLSYQGQSDNLPYEKPIAYLGHHILLDLSWTVAENIYYYSGLLDVGQTGYGDYLKTAFHLQDLWDIPCQYLSFGQKKRVAFCIFFSQKRAVYLLDEILTGLDSKALQIMDEFLKILLPESIVLLVHHGALPPLWQHPQKSVILGTV